MAVKGLHQDHSATEPNSKAIGTTFLRNKMTTKQRKYDQLFMDIAETISQMSHDSDTQVGAIIVKDGNILSMGFNGTPTGFPNECKDSNGRTLATVIHAEQNAIFKLARDHGNAKGSTLYTTHAPCVKCALAIRQSGISKVVYGSLRHDHGLTILYPEIETERL